MKRVISIELRDLYLINSGSVFDLFDIEILDMKRFIQMIGERISYVDGKITYTRKGIDYVSNFRAFHRSIEKLMHRGIVNKRSVTPHFNHMIKTLAMKDITNYEILVDEQCIADVYDDVSMNSCLNIHSKEAASFYTKVGIELLYFKNEYIKYRALSYTVYGTKYIFGVYCSDNTMSQDIFNALLTLPNHKRATDVDLVLDISGVESIPYLDGFELYMSMDKKELKLTISYEPKGYEGYVHVAFKEGIALIQIEDIEMIEGVSEPIKYEEYIEEEVDLFFNEISPYDDNKGEDYVY